jgi:hypothetical protein
VKSQLVVALLTLWCALAIAPSIIAVAVFGPVDENSDTTGSICAG